MLDVLTPRGQESLEHERACAALYMAANPGIRYVGTPKDGSACVDAVLDRGGVIIGVVEQKSRVMTMLDFARYDFSWLVTFDKLVAGREVAVKFGVPLVGFLYLVPDAVLLAQRLTNPDGTFAVRLRVEHTETQRTINGGSIIRANAYIDMRQARRYARPATEEGAHAA